MLEFFTILHWGVRAGRARFKLIRSTDGLYKVVRGDWNTARSHRAYSLDRRLLQSGTRLVEFGTLNSVQFS